MSPAFRNGNTGPAPSLRPGSGAKANSEPWTRLPPRGLADAPEWPVEARSATPLTMQEEALWNRLWTDFPQAHIWRRNRMDFQVAVYVRVATLCASGVDLRASSITVFDRLSKSLLLDQHALRAARCIIDEAIEEMIEGATLAQVLPIVNRQEKNGGPVMPERPSVRDRLQGGAPAVAPMDDESTEYDDEDD